MMKKILLTCVLAVLVSFPARADEGAIPILPHPKWFQCEHTAGCMAIEGACGERLAVSRNHARRAARYYGHWRGKRDCTGAAGSENAAPTLCVKKRCVFK